ncbi:MAG: FkbM family methyltransferase [Candidatus Riflebacteria bacterium]|nr:FkbM family methyltransferase [Candidatus Riflebacteria bacterium]
MPLSTRRKVQIAKALYHLVMLPRRCLGLSDRVEAIRDGIRWQLELSEGIDLALYLSVYEPSTVRACRELVRPGTVVLDIGANVGAHTLRLARLVGPSGRVVAFEPTEFAFRKLHANLALNPELAGRVTPVQAMLTDRAGAAPPPEIYSSWPLTSDSRVHAKHCGSLQSAAGARVVTLDLALTELGLERVDFVKLDVDGFECVVLEGARNTLEAWHPTIVLELVPYHLEEAGRSLDDLVAILQRAGYELFDLDTRAPLPRSLEALQATCMADGGRNVLALPRVTPAPAESREVRVE